MLTKAGKQFECALVVSMVPGQHFCVLRWGGGDTPGHSWHTFGGGHISYSLVYYCAVLLGDNDLQTFRWTFLCSD